jgi:2-methylisocitrate lyase-like PEP mutase family enzyme
VLPRGELEAIGYRLAIFPVTALLASVKAMSQVYAHLRSTASSAGVPVEIEDFGALTKLMGFEDVWEFDRRHAE